MAGIPGMFKRASLSPAYADAVRARIRAGGIVKRLEDHILGKVEMSASQVSAALGLLRKVVPDLAVTAITGPNGGPVQVENVTDLELARWMLSTMTAADEVIRKAKESASAEG